MTLKEVFAPHLNTTVKFGRKRSDPTKPHLKLANYLKAANLPTPPVTCDYTTKAAALRQMYLNDTLGDCVIAGGYHVVGTETGNAGDGFVATPAQITKDYSAIGDYVPGNPSTDNGCDLQTAMNYWTNNGFADGTKLVAWLAVDGTNKEEVMQAMYLFENLYFGMELPDAWINPMPSADGFTWGVGKPDPNNGHCVAGVGYNAAGVTIDTWALFGTLTWASIASLATAADGGELYVLLTPDQLAKGATVAPNGVAWDTLIADFNAMGGNVPVPAPVPTPPAPPTPPVPPTPVPTPPVPVPPVPKPTPEPEPDNKTYEYYAMEWAAEGIADNWPHQPGVKVTLANAIKWATKGLTENWPTS